MCFFFLLCLQRSVLGAAGACWGPGAAEDPVWGLRQASPFAGLSISLLGGRN